MICKVCKKYFRLKAENRYEVTKAPTLEDALCMKTPVTYECFDCPKCGCQNMVNVREGRKNDGSGN